MAALWLAVILAPASRLLPAAAHAPGAPLGNLRVEPRSGRLTWDLGDAANVTCTYGQEGDAPRTKNATSDRSCDLHVPESCQATDVTVTARTPRLVSATVQVPRGAPGTAAAGLKCGVHEAVSLRCRWTPGPAAPRDVRYRLYWEDLETHEVRECARYQLDGRGARVGCRFDNVSGASPGLQRLLVTGWAAGAAVPCAEVTRRLAEIETLSPPNVTGSCNGSSLVLTWPASSLLQQLLCYDVQLQMGAGPPENVTVWDDWGRSLVRPGAGSAAVRIRARAVLRGAESGWSEPRRFRCEEAAAGAGGDGGALLSAGLVLATLLAAAGALLLCWRLRLRQRLFPPIPRLKDPLGGGLPDEKMVVKASEDCPVAQVQVVGET